MPRRLDRFIPVYGYDFFKRTKAHPERDSRSPKDFFRNHGSVNSARSSVISVNHCNWGNCIQDFVTI